MTESNSQSPINNYNSNILLRILSRGLINYQNQGIINEETSEISTDYLNGRLSLAVLLLNRSSNNSNSSSSDLNISSKDNDEYPDFRTYPINIDWKEIDKGRSNAYDAMILYGYLGVSIYLTLKNKLDYNMSYKTIPNDLLSIYSKMYMKKSFPEIKALEMLISNIPNIETMEILLINSLVHKRELLLYKVILDILSHYYQEVDLNWGFLENILLLKEVFYCKYIDEKDRSTMKEEIIKNEWVMKYKSIGLKSEDTIKINMIRKKKEMIMLIGGNEHSKFIL